MEKTYSFHVVGMHCNACVLLTESELAEVSEVKNVKASLENLSVEVTGDFGDKTREHVARDLTEVLRPHGYTLVLEKPHHIINWSDFNIALPIAGALIALFILIQKIGVVDFVNSSYISYPTAFVIGLIASISTCMAVVGGLILSMSANFSKDGDRIRPSILFHSGRLISFFILGGVIGAFGSAFQLGASGTLIISMLVGIVLLILGINLLEIFPWAKRLQFAMPKFISRRVHKLKDLNHNLTPFLVGIITFFLPCGFTQSMQVYTLSTGSFWSGALTMTAYAFGTLPVLALLSFSSSFGIQDKAWKGIFFKTVGIVVVFFGIFNILNSLAAFGIIAPLFNF